MEKINFDYVMEVLSNNGIDKDYLDEMDGMVEGGGDEWMDVLSEIIGRDAYDASIEGDFTEEDNKKIMEFVNIMEENGIEFF